jgi:AcrR family transcriptional regulator
MLRDRNQTERRLIDAVGHLIAEEGLAHVGINRVARRSGVNKVLIYRYFGGLDGLLQAHNRRSQSWLSMPPAELTALRQTSVPEFFARFQPTLTTEVRQLQQNPEAQALLRAELCSLGPSQPDQPTATMYQPLADALANVVGGAVGRAYAELLVNGLVLLSLQRPADRADGDGWEPVEAAVQLIFQGTSRLLQDRQRMG